MTGTSSRVRRATGRGDLRLKTPSAWAQRKPPVSENRKGCRAIPQTE
jgi:hypothetical protein